MTATYAGCSAFGDFRELLGRPDIDAVEICTPDHWHAIMVDRGVQGEKEIYCQKPLSLTIAEGRAMSSAVSRSKSSSRRAASSDRTRSFAGPPSWFVTGESAN